MEDIGTRKMAVKKETGRGALPAQAANPKVLAIRWLMAFFTLQDKEVLKQLID